MRFGLRSAALAGLFLAIAALVVVQVTRNDDAAAVADRRATVRQDAAGLAAAPEPRAEGESTQAQKPTADTTPSDVDGGSDRRATRREVRPPVSGAALDLLLALSQSASAGDAEAAYALFELLEECRRVRATLKDDPASIRTLVRDCEQLPEDEIAQRASWVERAAEAGNLEARLAYPAIAGERFNDPREIARDTTGFERFRTNAVRYLRAAAEQGNVDAMVHLAMVYDEGLLAPADPVKAYAYIHAAAGTGVLRHARATVERHERSLSPSQIDAGRTLSAALLYRCCR